MGARGDLDLLFEDQRFYRFALETAIRHVRRLLPFQTQRAVRSCRARPPQRYPATGGSDSTAVSTSAKVGRLCGASDLRANSVDTAGA